MTRRGQLRGWRPTPPVAFSPPANNVGNYFVALLNGGTLGGVQVSSPASIARMWMSEPASGGEAYGFGWNEMNLGGMRLLTHSGDIGAAGQYGSSGSVCTISPDHHFAIGMLSNMSSLEKLEITPDALTILLGGEPAARPVVPDWRTSKFTPNRDVWAACVGEYQTGHGPLRLYRDGDKLLGLAAVANDLAAENSLRPAVEGSYAYMRSAPQCLESGHVLCSPLDQPQSLADDFARILVRR
jgi:CubicO group peptidase (beta-lactamase class C family)